MRPHPAPSEPVELLVPAECFLDAVDPETVVQPVLPALPPTPGPRAAPADELAYERGLRSQAQIAATTFRQERDAERAARARNAPVQNTCAHFMRGQLEQNQARGARVDR